MGTGAVEDDGSAVVSTSGVFSGGESTEPLAGTFTGLTNLGNPFTPAALTDATVTEFVVVGAAFAFSFTGAIIVVVVIRRRIGRVRGRRRRRRR